MNNNQLVEKLIKVARELTSVDTYECPECGSKVLKQTNYCVKCQKKVKDK